MIGKIYYGNTLVSNPTEGDIEITNNGTYDVGSYENAVVDVINTGSDNASLNDVNFYDYDGTLLYSYSKSDFASLSALPPNPSHDGLTAQGWNWSLSNAKTFVSNDDYLNIGQMYITSDGKTKFYFQNTSNAKILYARISGSTNISVDWGDGTSTSSYTSGTNHTYSVKDDYVVTITVPSNVTIMLGSSSGSTNVVGASSSAGDITLYKVEVGEGVVGFGTRCFEYCPALKSISMPINITHVGCKFSSDYSLRILIMPNTVRYIGLDPSGVGYDCDFSNCYNLRTFSFSELCPSLVNFDIAGIFNNCYNLEAISFNVDENLGPASQDSGFFNSCYKLKNISFGPTTNTLLAPEFFSRCYNLTTIPLHVSSIVAPAVQNCPNVKKIIMKSSNPPMLSGALISSTFDPMPDFQIYVPSGSKSKYTSATNWSSIDASKYIEY